MNSAKKHLCLRTILFVLLNHGQHHVWKWVVLLQYNLVLVLDQNIWMTKETEKTLKLANDAGSQWCMCALSPDEGLPGRACKSQQP
jgi:hypothetical protein